MNFDGLPGPTHNYSGLAHGNLAAERNAQQVSNPREAALQGLAKMRALAARGYPQAVLPPHERPDVRALRALGFSGGDADVMAQAGREAPEILAACSSAASMWVANAATVSAAADCADGRLHLTPANHTPFAPNGFTGIHQGAAIVFFAYIGFDAISTAAEETVNPQRNLPIGILGGLAVCTLIYVIVGGVLTGMVPYQQLASSADPLAYALQAAGFQRIGWIVALGAAVSMAAVLLVFQYGQPRIFFSMARDGLLPEWAARVHPKYRIPHVTTALTGILVALASLGTCC